MRPKLSAKELRQALIDLPAAELKPIMRELWSLQQSIDLAAKRERQSLRWNWLTRHSVAAGNVVFVLWWLGVVAFIVAVVGFGWS